MRNKKLVIFLTVLFAIPAAFFLFFMFGEVIGGDLSGLTHLLQVLPFIILIILVWKCPIGKK